MFFHVGIIYSARDFLKIIHHNQGIEVSAIRDSEKFVLTNFSNVLKLCQEVDWIEIDIDGDVNITSRGEEVLACGNYPESLRVNFLPYHVRQCFVEAELFSSTDLSVVDWWDSQRHFVIDNISFQRQKTGRLGEKLSLDYEKKRTGVEPYWQAIESDLAGYDILSVLKSNNNSPLMIEVKTSNLVKKEAIMYLTRNEWEVSKSSKNYVYHLWTLEPEENLVIIQTSQIEEHIPSDEGDGKWKNVAIPFDVLY